MADVLDAGSARSESAPLVAGALSRTLGVHGITCTKLPRNDERPDEPEREAKSYGHENLPRPSDLRSDAREWLSLRPVSRVCAVGDQGGRSRSR